MMNKKKLYKKKKSYSRPLAVTKHTGRDWLNAENLKSCEGVQCRPARSSADVHQRGAWYGTVRFGTARYGTVRLSSGRFAFPPQFSTAIEWAGLFTRRYNCAASTAVTSS